MPAENLVKLIRGNVTALITEICKIVILVTSSDGQTVNSHARNCILNDSQKVK